MYADGVFLVFEKFYHPVKEPATHTHTLHITDFISWKRIFQYFCRSFSGNELTCCFSRIIFVCFRVLLSYLFWKNILREHMGAISSKTYHFTSNTNSQVDLLVFTMLWNVPMLWVLYFRAKKWDTNANGCHLKFTAW